ACSHPRWSPPGIPIRTRASPEPPAARCPRRRRRRARPPPTQPAAWRLETGGPSRRPPPREGARWSPPAPRDPPTPPDLGSPPTGSARSGPSGDLVERLGDRGYDVLRKRDVPELVAELLSVTQAIANHGLERVAHLRVGIGLVAQQPGIRDDRVRCRRGRIGNPCSQVRRQLHAGERGRLALGAHLHEPPALVLERRHRHLRLLGVTVLHVADRARRLLDQRRDARVSLAADTDG